MLLLFRSLLEAVAPPEPPEPPATQGGGVMVPRKKWQHMHPMQSAPWHWVPFHPVARKRPRKKRDADLLLLIS
jgi:hypothetical protein